MPDDVQGAHTPRKGGSKRRVELGKPCAGRAECELRNDERETYPLKERDGTCYLGEIPLNTDGTILDGQYETAWSPSDAGVEFCAEGQCLTCTIDAPPDVIEPYCGGSPRSCYGRRPENCTGKCSLRSRVVPDILSGGTTIKLGMRR